MTILSRARAMRYEVGTNLKGRGIGATWHLLLPSLDIESAAVVGHISSAEDEGINRLAARRHELSMRPGTRAPEDDGIDLVVVGRGGSRHLRKAGGMERLAKWLNAAGVVYGESRGGGPSILEGWPGPARAFNAWPAFGTARAFVPADDRRTAQRLVDLGFLPPRGTSGGGQRALNHLASIGVLRSRLRRRVELGVVAGSALQGPPAYASQIARESGVDIRSAPWAVVAPGDYASQKVLLLLFDPNDHEPWMIVKLGSHPEHVERLQNEARVLSTLARLALPEGMAPALGFAGEHAGRGVVGQGWIAGRPFSGVATPSPASIHLATAVASLQALATLTVDRRPAAEVGAALRDLFGRFRSIHHIPEDAGDFLEKQVRSVEAFGGSLPVHFQHGDPGTWNLLARDDGTVAFLDWESAEVLGLPLWDLVHLQFSFGAWAARRDGARRRLNAALRHFVTPTELNARFAEHVAGLATAVDLPNELIRPLFYACWMHRALKEATRRTPATLDRGLYIRMLRELVRRRDDPALRHLLRATN